MRERCPIGRFRRRSVVFSCIPPRDLPDAFPEIWMKRSGGIPWRVRAGGHPHCRRWSAGSPLDARVVLGSMGRCSDRGALDGPFRWVSARGRLRPIRRRPIREGTVVGRDAIRQWSAELCTQPPDRRTLHRLGGDTACRSADRSRPDPVAQREAPGGMRPVGGRTGRVWRISGEVIVTLTRVPRRSVLCRCGQLLWIVPAPRQRSSPLVTALSWQG